MLEEEPAGGRGVVISGAGCYFGRGVGWIFRARVTIWERVAIPGTRLLFRARVAISGAGGYSGRGVAILGAGAYSGRGWLFYKTSMLEGESASRLGVAISGAGGYFRRRGCSGAGVSNGRCVCGGGMNGRCSASRIPTAEQHSHFQKNVLAPTGVIVAPTQSDRCPRAGHKD